MIIYFNVNTKQNMLTSQLLPSALYVPCMLFPMLLHLHCDSVFSDLQREATNNQVSISLDPNDYCKQNQLL